MVDSLVWSLRNHVRSWGLSEVLDSLAEVFYHMDRGNEQDGNDEHTMDPTSRDFETLQSSLRDLASDFEHIDSDSRKR